MDMPATTEIFQPAQISQALEPATETADSHAARSLRRRHISWYKKAQVSD
ncbi:hypothetical protein [Streptomyces sp. NRRL F-4489]|nr:hypothetical protein [Streptomyces sp. NRRL F-4489]